MRLKQGAAALWLAALTACGQWTNPPDGIVVDPNAATHVPGPAYEVDPIWRAASASYYTSAEVNGLLSAGGLTNLSAGSVTLWNTVSNKLDATNAAYLATGVAATQALALAQSLTNGTTRINVGTNLTVTAVTNGFITTFTISRPTNEVAWFMGTVSGSNCVYFTDSGGTNHGWTY